MMATHAGEHKKVYQQSAKWPNILCHSSLHYSEIRSHRALRAYNPNAPEKYLVPDEKASDVTKPAEVDFC